MIGFSAHEREHVAQVLAANTARVRSTAGDDHSAAPDNDHPVWKIADFREANALLMQAPYAPQGTLHFKTALNGNSPIAVNLSDLAVPYAIQWSPACLLPESERLLVREVSIAQLQSVQHALQDFEAALRPLRTLFAIADLIDERRSELDTKHVFHLVRNNALECILDIANLRIMFRDGIRPIDPYACDWLSRPRSANTLPPGFSVWALEEAAWIYALHSFETTLPKRYKKSRIYFRRLPRVRSGYIYPRHAALMELLAGKPFTFDELVASQSVNVANLERDLAALYQCRAITTDPKKLAKVSDSDGYNSGLFFRPSTKTTGDENKELQTFTGSLI